MESKEFQEEQVYLERVEKYIDKRILQLTDKKEELKRDISSGRRAMWEDGRHGVCDFDDVVDIYLHSEVIVSNENQYVENLKELQKLDKMKENPYFARIDVVEEGYPETLSLYIGAVGLRDDKTYDMYVCDWRAPMSALFYGFDVGEAWYEVEGRRIYVNLTRKRQIQIEQGELISIYDTDSSMHDAILGDILSQKTGNKLKVIVNSIQKEQNTAIRKIDRQAALIYGPAGSGKTSVGLHRLAYILYHRREQLKAEDIVILSNNNIYHSYVSGILPALCEDEVSHTIFHELLRKFLPKGTFVENYYAQYSALRETGREAQNRRKWLSLKYSKELLEYIREYFEAYEFEMVSLKYRGKVIVTAKELQSKFKRNKYSSFQSAFEGLLDTVKMLYEDYFEENKVQLCEEIELRVKEYISAQELEILFIKARKRAVQETIDELNAKNVLDAGEQLLRIMEGFSAKYFTDATQIQSRMEGGASRKTEQESKEQMLKTLQEDLENHHLWYEDALLYLLVRIYMGKVKPFQNVLHVLIDEAQDYHILQLKILKLLYPKSSFTLLADVCQAISPMTTMQSYEEFEWVFGTDLERLPLLKSYRSSGPINALAFQLMEMFKEEYAQMYSYFQREGKVPQYIVSTAQCATVCKKLNELRHYNLVGIITSSEREAVKLYHRLQERGETVQLITRPNDEMKERVIIMPLILTKGLEFDAVVVCDCVKENMPANELAAQMYLACTRALHELYFVEDRGFPEIMKECNEFVEIVYE